MIIHKILQHLFAFNISSKIITSFSGILGANAESVENWAASVLTPHQAIGIVVVVQLNHFVLDITMLVGEIINVNLLA